MPTTPSRYIKYVVFECALLKFLFVTGDCDYPGELTNGMVIFSNGTCTRDGSVITFQCDPGLSLVGDRVSQCRSGQWTVLPQDVMCTTETNATTSPPGELIMHLLLCIYFELLMFRSQQNLPRGATQHSSSCSHHRSTVHCGLLHCWSSTRSTPSLHYCQTTNQASVPAPVTETSTNV